MRRVLFTIAVAVSAITAAGATTCFAVGTGFQARGKFSAIGERFVA